MENSRRKNTFVVVNDEGVEIECDILFTFASEETHKNYIVYTDNSRDEEGNVNVYASIYYPDSENSRLEPIETDAEWKLIESILDTLQDEIKRPKGNSKENLDFDSDEMPEFYDDLID